MKRTTNPMPDFVKQALENRDLLKDYEQRPPYQQNDYIGWINAAKQQSTKEKRLAQMLDELELGGIYMKMEHPASNKGLEAEDSSRPIALKDADRNGSIEVDRYFKNLPDKVASVMREVRNIIIAEIPDCTERIAYGMPVFRLETDICGIQAHKSFCSLYTMEKELPSELKKSFPDIEISNSSIRFYPESPLSKDLVTAVINARIL